MKKEIIELGTFEVVSKTLRISDPCYDKDTWCAGSVKNVLPGTWRAQVKKVDLEDDWGNRCRKLCAVHEFFDKNLCTVEQVKFTVGVDSGQAGIFDDKFYKVDYSDDYLCTGREEYEQANELYRAKDNVSLFEDTLKVNKKLGLDAEYWKNRLEESKEILARGTNWDYSEAAKTREWYEVNCDKTLSAIGAGVIRSGVVSSSGDGDGTYRAYVAKNTNGKVVGVKILF